MLDDEIMVLSYILENDCGGRETKGSIEEFSGTAGKFIDYQKDVDDKTDGVILEID